MPALCVVHRWLAVSSWLVLWQIDHWQLAIAAASTLAAHLCHVAAVRPRLWHAWCLLLLALLDLAVAVAQNLG